MKKYLLLIVVTSFTIQMNFYSAFIHELAKQEQWGKVFKLLESNHTDISTSQNEKRSNNSFFGINQRNFEEKTLAIIAAEQGNVEVVERLLLDFYANPFAYGKYRGPVVILREKGLEVSQKSLDSYWKYFNDLNINNLTSTELTRIYEGLVFRLSVDKKNAVIFGILEKPEDVRWYFDINDTTFLGKTLSGYNEVR